MRKIKTLDFGEIECKEDDIITFKRSIYGFEDYRDFIILQDNPEDDLFFLQSIEDEALHFVILDPVIIDANYNPILSEEDFDLIKSEDGKTENIKYLVIVAIKENIQESVVNLRSPIAINADTKKAIQTIVLNEGYNIRHPLFVKIEDGD